MTDARDRGRHYSPFTSPGRAVILDFDTAREWDGIPATTTVAVVQLDQECSSWSLNVSRPNRALVHRRKTHLTDWSYPSGFRRRTLVGNYSTTTGDDRIRHRQRRLFQISSLAVLAGVHFEYAWQEHRGPCTT
jgi:hypothetical protein